MSRSYMATLTVNEIFYSIQGESTQAGRPCVFVRLTYCNLRCTYCDTAYAFTEGRSMSIDGIMDQVRSFGCNLVEITGGEPLFQQGALLLMKMLCDEGFETMLETGGSLDIRQVDPRVRRIVDVKCPSSGMSGSNLWSNLDHLTPHDEVKFVIGDREDFTYAIDVIRTHGLERRCTILLSPVFGVLSPLEISEWVLLHHVQARVQLQMHKYIWEPDARGV
jgi:7-carboxy-7-deazaguanine synthase